MNFVEKSKSQNVLYFCIILFFMNALVARAQDSTPEIEWVRQMKGAGAIQVTQVDADPLGNSYIGGYFTDVLALGATNLVSSGAEDGFLAKYDPAGNFLWARTIAGPKFTPITRFALSPEGEILATGSFVSSVDLGGQSFVGTSEYDWFVAKYSQDGNLVWAKQGRQPSEAGGQQICVDPSGNAYMHWFNRTNSHLTKFNSSGVVLWEKSGVASGENGLLPSADGSIFALGNPIEKWTPEGAVIWSTTGPAFGVSLTLDSAGSLWIGGQFEYSFNWRGTNYLPSNPDYPQFLSKFDGNGTIVGFYPGKTRYSASVGLKADWTGNIYSTGREPGPGILNRRYLSRVSPDGKEARLVECINAFDSVAPGLGVDKDLNFFLAGQFVQFISIGTNTLTAEGSNTDGYLFKLRTSPFSIVAAPQKRTNIVGTSAQFDVQVASGSTVTYQWRHSQTNLPGETTRTLTILGVQPTDSGDYDVVVKTATSSLTSSSAHLTVNFLPTSRISQPTDGSLFLAATDIAVVIDAEDELGRVADVQLFIDSALAARKANGPFTFTLNFPNDGEHILTAKVTDDLGYTVDSTPVKIVVGRRPVVTRNPPAVSAPAGANVLLSAFAQGTAPFSYQWFKDGAPTGPNGSSLILSNVSSSAAGNYTIRVTNLFGSASSPGATLTVTERTAPFVSILVNGQFLNNDSFTLTDPVAISLIPIFPDGFVFYTLDGLEANFSSRLYTGPFTLSQSAVLRTATYSPDFSMFAVGPSLTVTKVATSFTLSTATAGGGSIIITPSAPRYAAGAQVRLDASPLAGWTFLGWTGDSFDSNEEIVLIIDRPKRVRAHFGTPFAVTASGSGDLRLDPAAAYYPYSTVVRITALPEKGSYLAAWGGIATGNQNPLTLVITNATPHLSALFAPIAADQSSLTILATGSGTVFANPPGTRFASGQHITLTATPKPGETFLGWTGDLSSSTNPVDLVLDTSKTLQANFTASSTLEIQLANFAEFPSILISVDAPIGGVLKFDAANSIDSWIPFFSLTNIFGAFEFPLSLQTSTPSIYFRVN